MSNTKLIWAGIVIVALVAVAGLQLPPGGQTVVERVVEKLGSAAGPEDTFQDRSLNGVQVRTQKATFNPATSTVISFKSPPATSTPNLFCYVDTATTVASVWTVAESPGGFASTTSWVDYPIAADARADFGFQSTSTTNGSDGVLRELAPDTLFIVTVAGAISGPNASNGSGGDGFQPKGGCSVVFWAFNNY